jgi:hypothetical protein
MSAVDATVGGIVGAATAAPQAITRSIVDWLTQACENVGGSDYASCYYIAGLATILFVHYILYILENLSAFQYKGQTWKQAISEARQFLQVGVVRWLIFFASMIAGLVQGVSSGLTVSSDDLEWGMSCAQLVVVVLLVNKGCVLLTGLRNFGNLDPQAQVSSIGYGPISYVNVSAGAGSLNDFAVFNSTGAAGYSSAPVQPSNKPWWVFITWVQTVTDILLSNLIYPSILGYAGGKFAMVAAGKV